MGCNTSSEIKEDPLAAPVAGDRSPNPNPNPNPNPKKLEIKEDPSAAPVAADTSSKTK